MKAELTAIIKQDGEFEEVPFDISIK